MYQKYFQVTKDLSDFDAEGEDATYLAQLLMDDIMSQQTASRRAAVLREYCSVRASSLRSVSFKRPWLRTLFYHMIFSQTVVVGPDPCLTALSSFTTEDAELVGKAFSAFFSCAASPKVAVALWIEAHPALAELEVELPQLLRPFATRLAKCIGWQMNSAEASRCVEWEADVETDCVSREFVKKERILKDNELYSEDEKKFFDIGLKMEHKALSASAKSIVLNTNHLSVLREAFLSVVDSVTHGHVACKIRAAPIDVLALFMDNDCLFHNKWERGASTLDRRTLEVVNCHHSVFLSRNSGGVNFSDREFVGSAVWRKEKEGEENYILINVPTNHAKAQPSKKFVRGESVRVVRLRRETPQTTLLSLTFTMDLKGIVPSFVIDNIVIPANLHSVVMFPKYFQMIKPLADFDHEGEDAALLAQLLMDDVFSHRTAEHREEELVKYFTKASSLRSIGNNYPFFQELLIHMIVNQAAVRTIVPCKTPLRAFTQSDAERVGQSFASCLHSTSTGKITFLAWIASNHAMAELDAILPLFRPFVIRVAKYLLERMGKSARNDDDWEPDVVSDQFGRGLIVERILKDQGDYKNTEDEERGFEQALSMERAVTASKRVKKVRTQNTQLKATTTLVDDVLYGQVLCMVHASAIDVLAFNMHDDSIVTRKHERATTLKETKTIEIANDHRSVLYGRYSTPFADREFLGSAMWRRESDNNYFFASVPTDHEKAPRSDDIVRGESLRAYRFCEVSPGVTRVTFTFSMDLKGNIPVQITNKFVIPANLEIPSLYQKYFIFIKPESDFDGLGKDAGMLGQIIVDDVTSHKAKTHREEALQRIFVRSSCCRSISVAYPWFQNLVWYLLQNNVRIASTCDTPLSLFGLEDAKIVGTSLATTLLGSATAEMGVDEMILAFPAMSELDAKLKLFRPLVTRIAEHQLKTASWGMMMRVTTGALLSISNVASDVNILLQFYHTGHMRAFTSTICMILLNVSFQIWIVYLQHRRQSWRIVAREILLVLSFLKPAMDSYRIIKGGEQDPMVPLNSLQVAAYSKVAEVVLESIGGSVVQATLFLESATKTPAAAFSLATSALSIAYTVTAITYDLDTSPEKRKKSPQLYGMVPNQARGLVFILMLLLSLCQVVAKVFSIALLATTNSRWLALWMSSDVLLYMLYKVVRRDFVYVIPGTKGLMKHSISFFARLMQKCLADVTGILLVRLCFELGGCYYSFNTVASQAGCWIAAGLYVAHYGRTNKVDDVTIYAFIGVLQALWLLAVIVFFGKIKRAYWQTFFSTQSGRQYAVAKFVDNQDDATRKDVFTNHADLWSDIENDVKKFTLENWERWEQEKPPWFNDNFKGLVPDEFIPKAALDRLKAASKGRERRRSSLLGLQEFEDKVEKNTSSAKIVPERFDS